jgi:hypothetical protein
MTVENALDLPARRDRLFFFPDRSVLAPSLYEKRVR